MPKIRILLVEDDAAFARLVQAALNTAEIEFDVCTSGRLAEAVSILGQQTFNAILLDLNLPDSSGLQTLEAIAAVARVPIIVLTGLADEAIASQALRMGAQRFLRKTRTSTSSLIEAMREAVSLHRKSLSSKDASESATKVFEGLAESATKIEDALTELEQLQLAPEKSEALTSATKHLGQMKAAISRYLEE